MPPLKQRKASPGSDGNREPTWAALEEYEAGGPLASPHEFPALAEMKEVDRRKFLKLMGASMAMMGLAGCTRQPREKIVVHAKQPEGKLPGVGYHYATATSFEGYARGVLAESHEGRPIKIEGNPDHPASLGATDATAQASVLDLYDPDRGRVPSLNGHLSDWGVFDAELLEVMAPIKARSGRGLFILSEPTTSPTLLSQFSQLLKKLPEARWAQYSPTQTLARHYRNYDFANAETVIGLEPDYLTEHPEALRHMRTLATRRKGTLPDGPQVNIFTAEPVPSVTGTYSDKRVPVRPNQWGAFVEKLETALNGGSAGDSFFDAISKSVSNARQGCVIAPGTTAPQEVHVFADAWNERHGEGHNLVQKEPKVRSDFLFPEHLSLEGLQRALEAGEVDCLLILGSNPAHTQPGFGEALQKAGFSACMDSHHNETAQRCRWYLPELHYLESWGDIRSFTGDSTIQQPLIQPLVKGRSHIQMLQSLLAGITKPGYDIVRSFWKQLHSGNDFAYDFDRSLEKGIAIDEAFADPADALELPETDEPPEIKRTEAEASGSSLTLLFRPDAFLRDGRHANNPWLQELPNPLTKLTWDNALMMNPATAKALGVEQEDMVLVEIGGAELEVPALPLPGMAEDTLCLHMGHGRTAGGEIAKNTGFNAHALRPSNGVWQLPVSVIKKTGERYSLAQTQLHHRMYEREPVKFAEPSARHGGKHHGHASDSLYDEEFEAMKASPYQWGMAIDLSACTGCSACVVACQAENNIPVVGKEEVVVGREMHWIRVDRYFSGEPENPSVHFQPVPCMHCEKAPCEVVCPVAATTHSSEGLNEMTYNRCIGTRYCSNNCPYKVRRFNFFEYRAPRDSRRNLQHNPRVTVRERGVMEKCTYCVQRINSARIDAQKENDLIRDGQLKTACQQVCPAEAISFGNLRDKESEVVKWKDSPNNYSLLEELDVRPRTTYLAKWKASAT